MARPARKGLGYFPLDTDFLRDRKIRRLSQKFRSQGVITYIAALCEIYESRGYYVPFSAELCFDLSFTLQLEQELVEQILIFCVEIRLFDRDLLIRKGVLTSCGIQMRFREICKRSSFRIDPELTLLPAVSDGSDVADAPGAADTSDAADVSDAADASAMSGKPKDVPPGAAERKVKTIAATAAGREDRGPRNDTAGNNAASNNAATEDSLPEAMENPDLPVDKPGIFVDNSRIPVNNRGISVNNSSKPVNNLGKFVNNLNISVNNLDIPVNNFGIPVDNFGISAPETGISAAKTGVSVTKTRVSAAKTPLKGKGNKKGNKKENRKGSETIIENHANHAYTPVDDHGEAARRAELLRMALEATKGR